jgi:hypothetical protein
MASNLNIKHDFKKKELGFGDIKNTNFARENLGDDIEAEREEILSKVSEKLQKMEEEGLHFSSTKLKKGSNPNHSQSNSVHAMKTTHSSRLISGLSKEPSKKKLHRRSQSQQLLHSHTQSHLTLDNSASKQYLNVKLSHSKANPKFKQFLRTTGARKG